MSQLRHQSLFVLLMMKNNTEKIIQELCAIDPSLKDVENIRGLVRVLMESRPDAKIDDGFVKKLRGQILSQTSAAEAKIEHNFNWWLVHLLPFGAIAALVLLSNPQGERPKAVPSSADMQRTMEFAPAAGAPRPSLMMVSGGPTVDVTTQKPGDVVSIISVTLESPSYIGIHTDKAGELGEVIGKSGLLPAGRSDAVVIELSRSMKDGEKFHAALYSVENAKQLDSNDAANSDAPKPISVPFTVSKDALPSNRR